jgi:uncharacterized protein (TIGR00369 family)
MSAETMTPDASVKGGAVVPVAFDLDPNHSGREMLERWRDLGFSAGGFLTRLSCLVAEMGEGYAKIVCDIDPGHANFVGLVHGGVTAAMIDMAGGGAALSLLKPGEAALSADITMRYLNPIPADCPQVTAEGRVTYHDARKIIVDVTVTLPDGQVAAMGVVGMAVRKGR